MSEEKENYFKELLPDRENPYEIDVELEIRKIFEKITDYTFEFQKNDNKYEYDISVFKYYIENAEYVKKLISFIEIEVSETWINEYPEHWGTYSFLERKVCKFDWDTEKFTNELRDNADISLYVIFNKSLTDCVCTKISVISTFEEKIINKTDRIYNNSFLRTPLNDKRVVRGMDKTFEVINKFIKKCANSYN